MSGTVFIVDDDAAVRRALADILDGEGLAVRTFESAEAFLDACDAQAGGCILLDLRLTGMDGLQAQAELSARGITLPVIFLTGHGDVSTSVQAMKAGAADFLQKPVAADTLLARVLAAFRVDEARRGARLEIEQARARLARLTAREREVLERILAGRSAKEAGKELGISPRTIEVHRKNILLKTQTAGLLALSELRRIAETEAGVAPSQHGRRINR